MHYPVSHRLDIRMRGHNPGLRISQQFLRQSKSGLVVGNGFLPNGFDFVICIRVVFVGQNPLGFADTLDQTGCQGSFGCHVDKLIF